MSKRLIAALCGVLAIALIAVGCGGGDSSSKSTESAASPSKAEFIKAADAVCEEGNESVIAEAEEFAKENGIDTEKPTTAEQEEVVREVVAPAIRQQAEDISDLAVPSGDEAEVEAIVAAVETGADRAEEDPGALVQGKGGGPFGEANELADAYGLKVCGGE